MPELLYWLWLSAKLGVRPSVKMKLFRELGGVAEIFHTERSAFDTLNIGSQKERGALSDKSLMAAEDILRACEEKNISVINFTDEGYPDELRRAYDPPLTLYARGRQIDFNSMFLLTIAGTRSASDYGIKLAAQLGRNAALSGSILVSGLTRGIDEKSAAAFINAGGVCAGVLGTAIDAGDSGGLHEMVLQKGMLISEYPPGARTLPANFRARNRLLAGLPAALCVVEAPEKSGALLLADEAISQGKEVFVCPSNFGSVSGAGSNSLLKDGANLLSSFWDITDGYRELYPEQLRARPEKELSRADIADPVSSASADMRDKSKRREKSVDKAESGAYIELREQLDGLPELQLRVISALGKESLHVDDIADKLEIPIHKISAELTLMQIKGLVKRENGNRYRLNVVYK